MFNCGLSIFNKRVLLLSVQSPPPSISTCTVSNDGNRSSRADMSVHRPTAQSFRSGWSWVMSTHATSYSNVHELSNSTHKPSHSIHNITLYISCQITHLLSQVHVLSHCTCIVTLYMNSHTAMWHRTSHKQSPQSRNKIINSAVHHKKI